MRSCRLGVGLKVAFVFGLGLRRFGFKVRAEGSSGFRAIHICSRSFGFRLSGESPSGFKVKVEKARTQGFACRFFMFKGGNFEFRVWAAGRLVFRVRIEEFWA